VVTTQRKGGVYEIDNYCNKLPMAVIISSDDKPNASEKHESLPKHCALFLSSGAKNVDINDPM